MQFLVDESTGITVVEFLRKKGFDTLAVSEIMPQANDSQILNRAEREKRILITNDLDFGELAFRNKQAHYGIILLRLHNESPSNRVRVINSVIEQFANRLPNNFVVATESSIRIRRI